MMVRFGAIFLRSKIYVNGELAGEHQGGHTPIHIPLVDKLKARDNLIVVRADNRITWQTIPADTYFHPGAHGWWPYGGITRAVTLHKLPDPWIFKVEPRFDSANGNVIVKMGIWADSDFSTHKINYVLKTPLGEKLRGEVEINIDRIGFRAYKFIIETPPPELWSREHPENIYLLILEDKTGGDFTAVRFGYRTFEIDGTEIFLNGEKDFWLGINRHSDYPDQGPVETEASIDLEIEKLLKLNVNHIRPGHYPVDEKLLDALCDSGITILEEIPVYQLQFGQMSNEHLLQVASYQMAEMVERDKNNPAILAWSVGNEYGNFWPGSGILTQALSSKAKQFNPARPTLAVIANVSCVVPIDFALRHVDMIGINQYYGWYMGNVQGAGRCMDTIHNMYPNKPLIATEFGAGAVAGRFLESEPGPEGNHYHSYSEDYQLWFLQNHFDLILAKDYISGTMPWVFSDFRMEWDPSTADPHPVTGMNLKGLLSHDRNYEKLSFKYVSDLYRDFN